MRSPAAAVAWEFRQRHRWGWIVLTALLPVLAAIKLFVLEPGQRVNFNDETFALVVVVPLTAMYIYFLAVFSFGLSGDLAARQSIYPARMFTLPVTTAALAGWPMLYGTTAAILLWFATRLLAVWPSDVEVPIVWPALLGASLLAWTQALTWMPYALPGLRVIVTVLWLVIIDAVVMLALDLKAPEPVMLAILAPHVPLAFLVARFAVARARRGDVPDWRKSLGWLAGTTEVLPRRQEQFSSPARAQQWFEWRLHGRSLAALVGILLPFELALLFVFSGTPPIVYEVLAGALLTPPFMAAFVAATVRESNLTPFIATRPLTDASLIAAKLKATISSTLAAWLLVLIAVPLALRLSGTAPLVMERAHQLFEVMGAPRAVGIVVVGLLLLMASTWKQLVQSLYIGMSGREWLIKGSLFVALSVLAVILPIAHWMIGNRAALAVLWNVFPWIAAVLVCFKISAAAWIAVRLRNRRLLSDRTLLACIASWDVIVFGLYGLFVWIFPALVIRHYVLALVAILEVPLARLAAAPLALAWNRHR